MSDLNGNAKYWENRLVWNMYHYMEEAEDTADEITRLYQKASGWLTEQAKEVFEKYRKKHHLSEADARRLLNIIRDKTSVDDMIAALKNGDFTNKAELIAELEAPAYQARLEHFRQLQNQLDLVMQEVYKHERAVSTKFYADLANEAYYRSIFEIQKRGGLAIGFNHVDSKQIDSVLSMNWSGKHYSDRIWKNTRGLSETLKQELLVNLVTGRTEREAAEIIANKFGQSAMQSRRLVRTESCFISGELMAAAYEECEIEKYRYLATLDLRTSKVCRELDGQVFQTSERKTGKNYPPMHPWCRSTTVSVIDGECLEKMERRARDPVTGKTYMVPASMTYPEWYQKYVVGNNEAELEEHKVKRRSSDRKQHERYRQILGDEIPESFAKFQEMKYNEPEKWNSIKLSFRRKNNQNTAFESLQEPMQSNHIKKVLSGIGIDYGNAKIKIIRDPKLVGKGFYGWTNPNGKEVQLYPDAFSSREELVKTLGHERVHLEQIELFGPARDDSEAVYYERGPRFSEDYWWEEYRRRTNYDGK